MFTRPAVVLLAAFFATGTLAGERQPTNPAVAANETAQAQNSLRGVWKVVEQSSRTPGAAWVTGAAPQVSRYIFTQRHYSYMFVPGAASRRLFTGDPNQPTDAEKVAAYNSFVAGSGTYVLAGSVLTLSAILHKNPNEMIGAPLTYSVDIGPTTLRMTIVNPPFAPGQERRTLLTRIE